MAVPTDASAAPAPARERLLRSARHAFAERGFDGASTHAIAAAAELPQGLVRHHFGSKRGLWLAVLDHGLAGVAADLAAREPLSVRDLVELAPKHAQLLRVVLHGVLEPAAERALLLERLTPLLRCLRALHHAGRGGAATEVELAMWLGGLLAVPVVAAAFEPTLGASIAERRTQREALAAWLIDITPSVARGPWSLAAARARLRGG